MALAVPKAVFLLKDDDTVYLVKLERNLNN